MNCSYQAVGRVIGVLSVFFVLSLCSETAQALVCKGSKPDMRGGCTCLRGHYKVNRTLCKVCPPGSYKPEAGNGKCTKCKPGYESRGYINKCRRCPAGQYSDGVKCKNCPRGTQALAGSEKCIKCDGYLGKDGKCIVCKGGILDKQGKCACQKGLYLTKSNACKQCPPGSYGTKAGVTQCIKCKPGTGSPGFTNSCKNCRAGQYSTDGVCKPCPAGTASGAGAKRCNKCPLGSISSIYRKTCITCPAGQYSDNPKAKSCEGCPAGYISKKGSRKCTPCPKGTVVSAKDACSKCGGCTRRKYGIGTGAIAVYCKVPNKPKAAFYCEEKRKEIIWPGKKLGERCSKTRNPCARGLSCQPGVHKCYHVPRRRGEPCVAGHPCKKGLRCIPFRQVCGK